MGSVKLIANYVAVALSCVAAFLFMGGYGVWDWTLLIGTFAVMKLAGWSDWPWGQG
ncbi:hypothetical protein [Halomonas elongata]|uniref:hypothetical protein n=1 Tax=Halomonas elongata TaxID=2746 RepID=UPI00167084BD|nr:hypothetical protein [Halomonas elongata]